jgi:spoIIIJ-associated protein
MSGGSPASDRSADPTTEDGQQTVTDETREVDVNHVTDGTDLIEATAGSADPLDEQDPDESVPSPAPLSPSDRLEQEGDIAADYLEGLLDIADLDGDIDMDVEGDRALVSIVGANITELVGRNGEVLDALQELTRLAVLRETGERSRLMLDVAGHRARLREELTERGTKAAEEARNSGEPVRLVPMTPFERKVVHDAVAAAGLTSESEGVEPGRYVVVLPR